MQSKAATVEQYLTELSPDRREAIEQVRALIKANLDPQIEEGMQYGMIGFYVPHSVYPPGYHCDPKQPLPFIGLASQKNHLALYMMCQYTNEGTDKAFREAWRKTGKKLDMGKSCIRFKKVEDLALDVIASTVKEVSAAKHIDFYERVFKNMRKEQAASRKAAKKSKAKKVAKPAKKVAKRPKKAAKAKSRSRRR